MTTAHDRQAHHMPTAHERAPAHLRADTLSPEGRPRAALTWLRRQLLLVPEAVLLTALLGLHSLRGPSPLLALLGLAVTVYFGARVALLALGRQALAAAAYERAERLAGAAALMHPASADAQALRGALALARGDATAAVGAFERAAALFPGQPELQASLGAALLEDGRPQEARAAALSALAANRRSPAAHLHLASAEEQLGAAPEHVEALLRAGLALPARPAEEGALRCALAALLLRQSRLAEARLALAGAEGLLVACPAPQRAGLHYYLGELLRLGGDEDGARQHYSASESADPHGPYAAASWRAARS